MSIISTLKDTVIKTKDAIAVISARSTLGELIDRLEEEYKIRKEERQKNKNSEELRPHADVGGSCERFFTDSGNLKTDFDSCALDSSSSVVSNRGDLTDTRVCQTRTGTYSFDLSTSTSFTYTLSSNSSISTSLSSMISSIELGKCMSIKISLSTCAEALAKVAGQLFSRRKYSQIHDVASGKEL